MAKGWHKEPRRHAMAAKGIKTAQKMNYRQLKSAGYNLKPTGDADKDGVPNSLDCKPLDPTKHAIKPRTDIVYESPRTFIVASDKGALWQSRFITATSGEEAMGKALSINPEFAQGDIWVVLATPNNRKKFDELTSGIINPIEAAKELATGESRFEV